MRFSHRTWWIVIAVLLYASLCFIFFPESIDDAFITLRYSHNLILGNGPVFNVGEHVEGYSNFTWMILLAFLGKIGFYLPMAMKIASVISGAIALLLTGHIAKRWYKSELAGIVACLLVATSSFYALWAADGLETIFYSLLLTTLLYACIQPDWAPWLIGVLAGLVALTRPEGAMFGLIGLMWIAWYRGLRSASIAAIPFGLCVGGYEAFRLLYFHEWLSNTAYAKVHPSAQVALKGLTYLYDFNRASGLILIPVAAFGFIANYLIPGVRLAAIFIGAQVFFLIVSGGDFMFGYRFVVPVLPLICILAAGAPTSLSKHSQIAAVVLAALTITSLSAFEFENIPEKNISLQNLTRRDSVHFAIGDYLAARTSDKDTILLSEAGIIPFSVNAQIIDYLGLTTPRKDLAGPNGWLDGERVLSKHPKYVVLTFVQDTSGAIWPRMNDDKSIADAPDFKKFYKPIARYDIDKTKSLLNYIYYYYAPSAKVIYFQIFEREDNSLKQSTSDLQMPSSSS